MIELQGKYNTAKVFTDNIEQEAISQIIGLCNHPAFQNAKISVMPDCLIETTEILTDKGFKFITDLKSTDLIANVSENGTVFFSNPLNIIVRKLRQDEKVYEITDNRYGYTMISTENHRNAYKKDKGIKTKDLPDNLVVCDFIWNGRGLGVQRDYDISDIRLQLLAWVIGDGNIKITHNTNSDNYRIRFGFKKERKINRVLDLLSHANLKYTVDVSEKQTTIYLNTESSKWFVDFVGLKKQLPIELATKLSKRQAKLFIDEAIQVDGDYEYYLNRRGIRFNSKDIYFMEFIAVLFTLNFGTVKLNNRTGMTGFKKNNTMYYTNCVLEERLNYSKSGLHNTKLTKREIEYDGKVVCVTCDTGFFIARQEGRTFVTGNCHAGAGCTIGTTIKLSEKKIVPNLVGVDIGCFVGDTMVPVIDEGNITLKDLADRTEPFWVYTVNDDGVIVTSKALCRQTRKNASVMRVFLDNGESIVCTLDHKFMLRDGAYCEAQNLLVGQSLMPLTKFEDKDGYILVYQPNLKKTERFNRTVAQYCLNLDIVGKCVHHKDERKQNNRPCNLELKKPSVHSKDHLVTSGRSNYFKTEEFKDKKNKTIEGRGFYFDNQYAEKKKIVAINNIQSYMQQNPEDFAAVVQKNADRGSAFFSEKNSDFLMISKQRLGNIAKTVARLESKNLVINAENYDMNRGSKNSIRFVKAEEILRKFNMSWYDITDKTCWESKILNNHKVLRTEILDKVEDVYCLTVENFHNFALTAGVFVHNCGVSTTVFKSNEPLDFAKVDAFIRKEIPSGMKVRERKHTELKKDITDAIKEVVKDLNLGNLNYHLNSVGTLGGGNHYIEIGQIDENTFALSIHTGSRNLGKKVCEHFQLRAVSNLAGGKRLQEAQTDLIAKLKKEHREKDINKEVMNLKNNFEGKITGIPKELAYIEDEDFDAYIVNMIKCQRMASESRRLMAHGIINLLGVDVVEQFDTIHNYIEQSKDGSITIRKGAISAKDGEKVAIPLNMRDGVIIAVGKGNKDWNESAPHGAGRLMSRSKAKSNVTLEEFEESMKGIYTTSVGQGTIDESPMVYKPMQEIIDNVQDTVDILSIIKPLYNFKASEEPKAWEK